MRPTSLLRTAAGPAPVSYSKALAYATSLVRTSDADAIYASYFFPSNIRPAYLALRAFNVELASLDDQVKNPMVGRMRYQWWRDTVKGAFDGRPPPHPLATLLASLPQLPQLSSYHFTRLINARENHFLNPSFSSLQDLADYSSGTQASLLYLLLQATAGPSSGVLRHTKPFEHVGNEHPEGGSASVDGTESLKDPDDLTLDHAASHLAVANTIAILLRSIPHHATKRINVIPTEIAGRHGLTEESLFRHGPETEGLRECVATMVGIAQAELRTARGCFDGTTGVPERAVPVFLSATPARSYLDRLDQANFDVFDGTLLKRSWKVPFQIWGDARNKQF